MGFGAEALKPWSMVARPLPPHETKLQDFPSALVAGNNAAAKLHNDAKASQTNHEAKAEQRASEATRHVALPAK